MFSCCIPLNRLKTSHLVGATFVCSLDVSFFVSGCLLFSFFFIDRHSVAGFYMDPSSFSTCWSFIEEDFLFHVHGLLSSSSVGSSFWTWEGPVDSGSGLSFSSPVDGTLDCSWFSNLIVATHAFLFYCGFHGQTLFFPCLKSLLFLFIRDQCVNTLQL